MSLDAIEREEQDRIQYEMQLAGQGGKKCKVWPASQESQKKPKPGPVKVASSEDYMLTLENIKR